MRFLLTSAGIKNTSIHTALVDLLGKQIADSNALCIPTAGYGHPHGAPAPPDAPAPRTWRFALYGDVQALRQVGLQVAFAQSAQHWVWHNPFGRPAPAPTVIRCACVQNSQAPCNPLARGPPATATH